MQLSFFSRHRFHHPFHRLRRYPVLWWLLVVATALVIGATVTQSIRQTQQRADRFGELVTVPVASHQLAQGIQLSEADYRLTTWPSGLLPRNSPPVIRPQGLVLTVPVDQGQPITSSQVGGPGLGPITAQLHNDEQALAIPTSPLTPPLAIGDMVDVYATRGKNGDDGSTSLIVKGARVVASAETATTAAVAREDAAELAHAIVTTTVSLVIVRQS